MFYILNYANHQFLHCHAIPEVAAVIVNILGTSISEDDIEIVNCFADDSRLSVDEFFTKYAEEGTE